MTKTTFDDPTEGEGPDALIMRKFQEQMVIVSALTAEDAARQLLDPLAAMLVVRHNPAQQLELAKAYTSLAQAYIIKDAIATLKSTTQDEGEPSEG